MAYFQCAYWVRIIKRNENHTTMSGFHYHEAIWALIDLTMPRQKFSTHNTKRIISCPGSIQVHRHIPRVSFHTTEAESRKVYGIQQNLFPIVHVNQINMFPVSVQGCITLSRCVMYVFKSSGHLMHCDVTLYTSGSSRVYGDLHPVYQPIKYHVRSCMF